MKTDIEEKKISLNEYQQVAVLDESPACVVNANVGSGKTTVLIAKILYLHLKCGIPLEEMVVLTFTNKAADEIISRLLKQEPSLTRVQVQGFGTFHSVAMRFLKAHLPKELMQQEQSGWTDDFTVIDPDEEADLALDIIAEHQLKIKYKNRLKKRLEQERNQYLQGKETARYGDDLFLLYPLLEAEKKRQNKMSFSDLLRVGIAVIKNRKNYPKWVIVDEVQDSDLLQMDFLDALKGPETKLFAVGDPNQVIYSWRGTAQNMFYLLKHRFEARELSLPINYRSSSSILEAANKFLQSGSSIQGFRDAGNKIAVKNHYDPFQEAEYLAERIRTLHENGSPYGEIAVFYRLQKQSEILEKVFERSGIPCEVSMRKTIREIPVLDWLMKVLRFSVNPADEQIGIQVLTSLQYGVKYTKKRAMNVIRNHKKDGNLLYSQMAEFSCREWKNTDVSKEEIFAYFHLHEALHPTSSAYEDDEKLALEFLDRLCSFCREGQYDLVKGTREFVNDSSLYGLNADLYHPASASIDSVKLMTLHASKGLEFDRVFLIGVNPGLIPLRTPNFDQEEEERRLFFVGITRARNELELSYYTNPSEPGVLGEPSRYLRMIPEHLLDWKEVRSDTQKRANLQNLRRQIMEQRQKQSRNVKHVKHRKYGEGILISEDDVMVEVEFEGYGRKQFLKAFKEVTILDE